MVSKRRIWLPASPKPTKLKVSNPVKLALKEKADEIIESVIKPKHIKPPSTDNDLKYIVDVYSNWYKKYF